MKIFQRPRAFKKLLRSYRRKRESVGFVPTMGYLHEGHLSLVRRSRKEHDRTVVSLFVNPLQFGAKEDLSSYPRDLSRDAALLRNAGVDALFAPEASILYPPDFQTKVLLPNLSKPLCGNSRPLHFSGVATVVLKLLNLVQPDVIYLGQKDYQQLRVIEQMVKDLEVPVKVRGCSTVREKDGLAMSSRNIRLDAEERMQATRLSGALSLGEKLIRQGRRRSGPITQAVRRYLSMATRAKVDYVEIVDAETLLPVVQLKKGQKVELALAVNFSKARLIDNRIIRV